MKKITKILKRKFKNFNPKLKEECGVFGISDNQDASTLSTLGLHALQHSGQEGCGVVTFDGKKYHSEKRFGLVGDNFNKENKINSNDIQKLYSSLIKQLKEYEKYHIDNWNKEVSATSQDKLHLTLLKRGQDDNKLIVNFDEGLVRLLREVKYFLTSSSV